MSNTQRLLLPYLAENQALGHVTHNEAVGLIDAILCGNVKDRDTGTPPGSPTNGDMYIVGASPTGAWTGQAGKLAIYLSGWHFLTLPTGATFFIEDERRSVVFDGSNLTGMNKSHSITSNSAAIANTVTSTNFNRDHTLPSAVVNRVGATFRCFAAGIVSWVSSATHTLRLLVGGVNGVVITSGGGTSGTNEGWTCEFMVTTRATGSSGTVRTVCAQSFQIISRWGNMVAPSEITVNLTVPVLFQLQNTWSAASASNTITLTDFVIEEL